MTEVEKLKVGMKVTDRVKNLLARHVRWDDGEYSDRDLILKVMERWKKDQSAEICDVGE